jgi:endonuclease YncB( thermonuclease family)
MRLTLQVLALAFVSLLLASPSWAIGKCGSGARVTCVVDGDTLWLNGEKIRAMGYDTPEPITGLCGGERERQLAARATVRLIELFNTTQITFERHGKDRYDRTLAVLWSDGRLVGDILISEGLARSYPDGPEFWCY